MRQQRRNPADRAGLSFDIEQRKIAFRRGIEFEDMRNREPLRERLPDVAAQSVAEGQPQPCLRLELGRRRLQKVAAELADILEERAIETHDVVPEVRSRRISPRSRPNRPRAACCRARRRRPTRMMERQAIVEPVVDGCVRQPGKPSAPAENAAMADVRRLRQPRGARGVDEERTFIDRDVAAFGGGQRARVRGGERRIQIGARAAGTEAPDLRHAIQMRTCGLERIHAARRQE